MKLLFDNQIFDLQKYGGISRYFSELLKVFNSSDNLGYELPIRNSNNEYLKQISPFREKNISPHYFSGTRGKYLLYKLLDIFDKNSNKNLVVKALKKQDFDIFHPTYYSPYFLKYLKNKPFVLTIHDMIPERYPEYFSIDINKTAVNKKKLALKANKIIAISENTKKDIINFYGISEDKIEVIYHGNSLKFNEKINNNIQIPNKYILYIGSRSGYKNFENFIIASAQLLKEDDSIKVVAIGGYSVNNNFSADEQLLFKKLGIENRVKHYSVDDNSLAYFYKNALCFVFPSLYEGFGLPILEAFSCSCPVVASNTSSLPEIGGDAAVYFDPNNIQDIFHNIKLVISDNSLRDVMISKGHERLKNFSWDKTAEETLNLYSSVIKKD